MLGYKAPRKTRGGISSKSEARGDGFQEQRFASWNRSLPCRSSQWSRNRNERAWGTEEKYVPRPGGLNQAEEGLREPSGNHATLLDVKGRAQGHRGIQHPGHGRTS